MVLLAVLRTRLYVRDAGNKKLKNVVCLCDGQINISFVNAFLMGGDRLVERGGRDSVV
jgi:hypothetical protein